MLQENVEMVRGLWEPFKGLDFTAIDWEDEVIREWLEPFSEYYIEPLDFIERAGRVIIPQRQWGIGSTSGVPVEIQVTHVYEVRDGQIARVDEYDTLEEALEAVGLSAQHAHRKSLRGQRST